MSLSDEIIKVLDALAEKFGIVINWTSQNIIPYLEQLCGKYTNYEIATSVVWLIFGIGCLILGRTLFKTMKYCCGKSDGMDMENGYSCGCIFAAIGCGISIVVGLIVVICQSLDIVTCLTFPEKIILDELKSIYISMENRA